MKLSIVVICHNMRREAARTLQTLSPAYQRGVAAGEYEVIVIDNGSDAPLDRDSVTALGAGFRYHFHDTDSVSPVEAVNLGARMARGAALAVIVDGARMATPGIIAQSLRAMRLYDTVFVCALSWHLGPDIQPRSIQHGYDQAVEDRLLGAVDWRRDGYQLFAISTISPSSRYGFLGALPPECSWFCLPRDAFERIGGFNPAFVTPGGGFCNQDFRNRAVTHPGMVSAVLLGEGLFHQVHGGAATNAPPDRRPLQMYHEEYRAIVGKPFVSQDPLETVYIGAVPEPARRYLML